MGGSVADNLTTQSATPATVPASSVISTEEVTTLNGGAVAAQHVQRVVAAVRTADGTAIDLPATSGDGLLVNLGSNNDVTVTGAVEITNDSGSAIPVSAAALPLPSGAATAANQATEQALLAVLLADATFTARIPTVGQKARAASVPTTLSTEDVALLDGLEASLSSLDGKAPALGQALAAASVPVVLPAAQITTLTPPAAITGFLTESDFDTKVGSLTETAPATDTASSGLNGRLQRIAQRLTSLIAQLPASLGQKAKAASLAVVLASDQDALAVTGPLTDAQLRASAVPTSVASLPLPSGAATAANQSTEQTRLGDLTETAPASDTASSGLNGRLQRIAQRLTSLIALLPTALGAGGGLKVDGSGTALPVSAAQSGTWTVTGAGGTFPVTDSGGSLTVDGSVSLAAALPAGTNNIGDVDVLSLVPGTGATALGKAEDAVAASGDTGVAVWAVRRDTATSGAADGDYVSLNVDANGLLWTNAQGAAAHDAVAVGNPVQMGGFAETTRPAAVADADAVRLWVDEVGRQVVQIGSGEDVYTAAEYTSNQTDAVVIAAPGASLALRIFDITVSTQVTGTVLFEDGTTTRLFGRLSLPAYGGWQFSSPKGVKLTANQALTITTTTGAGPLAVTVNSCVEPA